MAAAGFVRFLQALIVSTSFLTCGAGSGGKLHSSLPVRRFDFVQNESRTVDLDVTLSSSVGDLAAYACAMLFNEAAAALSTELDRCFVLATHTLRDQQLILIQRTLASLGVGYYTNWGEVFALLYAYQSRKELDYHNRSGEDQSTVLCVFGVPPLSSLTAMVVANNRIFSSLWIFTPSAVQLSAVPENGTATYQAIATYLADSFDKTIHFFVGDAMQLLAQLHTSKSQCGALHFSAGIPTEQMVQVLKIIAVNTADNVGSLRVVAVTEVDVMRDTQKPIVINPQYNAPVYNGWQQQREQVIIRNSQSSTIVLKWDLFSTWLLHSLIDLQFNADGFSGRIFQFSKAMGHLLSHVSMGRLSNKGNLEACDAPAIIITYTIRVFAETAHGLERALHAAGYEFVRVLPDITPDLLHSPNLCADWYGTCDHNIRCSPKVLQIALGPHDLSILTTNYIVFQMEQIWSEAAFRPNRMLRFNRLLSNARCIFTFSYSHAEMLKDLQFPCVYKLPLYSLDSDMLRWSQKDELGASDSIISAVSQDYETDVLFFGSCMGRRIFIIQALGAELQLRNITLFTKCAHWSSAVFDSSRHAVVSGAKIIVNFHGDERSVLEVHRINYLLSMSKCVVSERGTDELLNSDYEKAVYLLPPWILERENGNLSIGTDENRHDVHEDYDRAQAINVSRAAGAAIATLLNDEEMLIKCRKQAQDGYFTIMKDVETLKTAMNAALAAYSSA